MIATLGRHLLVVVKIVYHIDPESYASCCRYLVFGKPILAELVEGGGGRHLIYPKSKLCQ